jgi:hypothetical protein
MATRSSTPPHMRTNALQVAWQARVLSGTFSPGVAKVGTVRVMGKAGDAPVAYPVLVNLEAVANLSPEESWAVQQAEQLVIAAQQAHRGVLAVLPGQLAGATPVAQFDPRQESVIILNQIQGG